MKIFEHISGIYTEFRMLNRTLERFVMAFELSQKENFQQIHARDKARDRAAVFEQLKIPARMEVKRWIKSCLAEKNVKYNFSTISAYVAFGFLENSSPDYSADTERFIIEPLGYDNMADLVADWQRQTGGAA